MRVTLKQVAQKTGLCHQSVSDILNRRPGKWEVFAKETLERVERAAAELGYRPNTAAKAMNSGRLGSVALVLGLSTATSQLPPLLLHGIDKALAERDLHLMLARLPDEQLANAGFVPKILRELSVDGLLINYHAHIPKRMVDLMERYRIPSVWINSKQKMDAVYPDDFGGAYQATRWLIEKGHSRIGYADYSTNWDGEVWHYSSVDRRDGYLKAMVEAGLAPHLCQSGSFIPRGERMRFSRTWLTTADRPTAVLSYTPKEAMPILQTAMALGMSLPQDLQMVTFSGVYWDETGIGVPTVLLPEEQVGRRAVEMLEQKIRAPREELPSEAVPCGWRETTA